MSYKRHPQLIEAFTEIYLNQRSEQKGGTVSWKFHGENYEIWADGGRPLTSIEQPLIGWLLEENPVGQQMALDALYQFSAAFDLEEQRFIEYYRERKRQNQESERATPIIETRDPVFTSLGPN